VVNPASLYQPVPPAAFGRWPRRRLSGLVVTTLSLIGFLALSVLLFAKTWQAPTSSVAGTGSQDIGIIVWFLRWLPFALSHGQNPLVTNYLDFPSGVNPMWNASMPLVGLAVWPLTSSFGPIFSYNLLVTMTVGFSAWCAFLAVRRYVRNPAAAALGGLLYGFSPYMIAQSQGHLHVTLAFVPPLMLLVFDEILIRQRRPARWMGLLLGVLAAAQFLIAEELLASEALTSVLGIALLATLFPEQIRARRRHALAALGLAAAILFAVASIPVAFQFFGPQRVLGAVQIRNTYVSDLLGFVVPTAQQQFAPRAAVWLTESFSGYSSEWDAYLGFPLIALLAYVGVRFWPRPVVRIASTLLLVLAVLSLGATLHVAGITTVLPVGALALATPLLRRIIPVRFGLYAFPAAWAGLAAAPILTSVLPGRLMLYVFLFAALLLAVFADAYLGRVRTALPAALVIGAALLTLTPRFPFPSEPVDVPTYFTAAGVRQLPQGSVALVLPYARLANSSAMFWQAASDMRFRMPEGYALVPGPSFSSPPTATGGIMRDIELGLDPPALTDDVRQQVFADLTAWQVEAIVVGPMPYRDRTIAFFSSLTGRTPQEQGGVYLWVLGAK
jgi:hypothetical protein